MTCRSRCTLLKRRDSRSFNPSSVPENSKDSVQREVADSQGKKKRQEEVSVDTNSGFQSKKTINDIEPIIDGLNLAVEELGLVVQQGLGSDIASIQKKGIAAD
ncbi:hypothetical protein ACOSP7_018221 [Xanthoceras sorbifolium]